MRGRPGSAGGPTVPCGGRCARWARCWGLGHFTPAGRPAGNAIARARVEEVLALTGLEQVAGKRAGTFSLGMAQRLGIAAALLGDPGVLLLDEPVNGLDPEGIRWIRGLLRSLAAQGRAVLVSSHLISEMALMADRLVVIGQGRLLADTTVAELSSRALSLEEAFLRLTGDSAQYQARNMS